MCIRDLYLDSSSHGNCLSLKDKEALTFADESVAQISYKTSKNRPHKADEQGLKETYAVVWTLEAVISSNCWHDDRWQISRKNGRFILKNICNDVRLRPVVHTTGFLKHVIPIPLNGSFLLSDGDQIPFNAGKYRCNYRDHQPTESIRSLPSLVYDTATFTLYDIIDHKLGAGGFGQVVLAINVSEHRQVAYKIVFNDSDLITNEYNLLKRLRRHVR